MPLECLPGQVTHLGGVVGGVGLGETHALSSVGSEIGGQDDDRTAEPRDPSKPVGETTFIKQAEQDVEAAEQETAFVQHTFNQKCDGFGVLYRAAKDGLLQKTGIIQYYWTKKARVEIDRTIRSASQRGVRSVVVCPTMIYGNGLGLAREKSLLQGMANEESSI